MSDWVRSTLGALTLDEKLTLLAGRDLWHANAVERLGIPALRVSDGPNGVRGADGNHGPTSTSFPVGAAMGATWDASLIEEVGGALAHEARAKGAHVVLGPTVNIPRVPNAGRNFECFSEDPLLSGTLAAAYVRGLQAEGVAACIKHFVCNDQEHERFSIDARVDERALREIYLEPFRIAVEEARPWAAMSAYNTINGTTASEHPLLDDVLRGEMGFDGAVISDWYGTYGPGVMTSGLDLEMPGPGRWLAADAVREALAAGTVTEEAIDRKVGRLLALVERTRARERRDVPERAEERPEDRALARRVATESIVLLANDGILPLARPARIAVIGELAAETPHQGGGSSTVNAHRVVSVLDGLREAVGEDVEISWTPGCPVRRTAPLLESEALPDGLRVEYFATDDLSGTPVRDARALRSFLAFFGDGDAWVRHASFSLRMSGRYVARRSGVHAFTFGAAGRLRAWADGELVVDAWAGASEHTWSVDLDEGGSIELVVEFAGMPGPRWRFVGVGCTVPGTEPSIESAATAAAAADVAVVVAGLTEEWESEGFDRPDLRLPGRQDELIAAVAAAQPRTVVVLTAGSPVEMPWADQVAAVVLAWYGGQEVGHAIADVLLGAAEPGGRLPVTFPVDSRQHPGLLNFPGEAGSVRYGEGVYVGYRGFDRLGLEPRYAFGHGLSYTTFEAGEASATRAADAITVEVTVANRGDRPGSEIVQVYAHDIAGVDRRLAGFAKVRLGPGEERSVAVTIPIARFRWWDPGTHTWMLPQAAVALSIRGTFGTRRCSLALG